MRLRTTAARVDLTTQCRLFGSFAAILACLRRVRFTFDSSQAADIVRGRTRAIFGQSLIARALSGIAKSRALAACGLRSYFRTCRFAGIAVIAKRPRLATDRTEMHAIGDTT